MGIEEDTPEGHPVMLTMGAADPGGSDRARAEEVMRQAARLDAVGRLASGVAHDLNNLLTVLLGVTEELIGHVEGDPFAAARTHELQDATMRAVELTRQLLAFARQQPAQAETLDLHEVLRGFESMLRRSADGRPLFVESRPGAWVHIDGNHVEQLLLNLVVNARDASGPRDPIHIELAPADAHVVLTVRDVGSGMDQHTRLHLFDPFFTTKPADRGTGLGLATVYGIVKQWGGDIEVHSEQGMGTRMVVRFPRAQAPAATTPTPLPPPRLHAPHERVLVIEEHDAVRRVMARALRSAGYQVLGARSEADALHHLPARPHLVLVDPDQRSIDGRTLARRFRTEGQARVLLVSDRTVADGLTEPTLTKPFSLAGLLSAVGTALDG